MGDWDGIRKLRKGFVPNQRRLKNMASNLVESNLRAETLDSEVGRSFYMEVLQLCSNSPVIHSVRLSNQHFPYIFALYPR